MTRICSLVIIFHLFACNQAEKAVGHWHLELVDSEHEMQMTLDVSPDSIAYLDKYAVYGANEGKHIRSENVLFFPGDCGSGLFEYRVVGTSIHLTNDYWSFVGEKCMENCCTPLLDFKSEFKVELDLPYFDASNSKTKTLDFSEFPKHMFSEIAIGKAKQSADRANSNKYAIEISGQLVEVDEIGTSAEEELEKYTEERRKVVAFRIFADKEIVLSEMKTVINELNSSEIYKIVIAAHKENYLSEPTDFEYISVQSLNFESELTLGQYLSSTAD